MNSQANRRHLQHLLLSAYESSKTNVICSKQHSFIKPSIRSPPPPSASFAMNRGSLLPFVSSRKASTACLACKQRKSKASNELGISMVTVLLTPDISVTKAILAKIVELDIAYASMIAMQISAGVLHIRTPKNSIVIKSYLEDFL